MKVSEIAIDLQRKPGHALARSIQLRRGTRVGRRLLDRRDDLLLPLDQRRAAWPRGAIDLSLGDDSADLTATPWERF